jgi:hypothetical protein
MREPNNYPALSSYERASVQDIAMLIPVTPAAVTNENHHASPKRSVGKILLILRLIFGFEISTRP